LLSEKENNAFHLTQIEQLQAEIALNKKNVEKGKYAVVREDKQVELRVRELAGMKARYVELKERTDPLIASLLQKVMRRFRFSGSLKGYVKTRFRVLENGKR
jgi:hypothetical protein